MEKKIKKGAPKKKTFESTKKRNEALLKKMSKKEREALANTCR